MIVEYSVNKNPEAWGYQLLSLPYDYAFACGCPVLQAAVEHPAEGYAANLGWIQVLDCGVPGQEARTMDVPPHLSGAGTPWASWGVRPTFFDAPSTAEREFRFGADSFLAYSPDAVITPEVVPLCGFRWGYDVRDGERFVRPLVINGLDRWRQACQILGVQCPTWTFREGGRQ